MSNQKALVRAIKHGQDSLRLYRHMFVKELYGHGSNFDQCIDDDESDTKLRRIGKALGHLKKAKEIVEELG